MRNTLIIYLVQSQALQNMYLALSTTNKPKTDNCLVQVKSAQYIERHINHFDLVCSQTTKIENHAQHSFNFLAFCTHCYDKKDCDISVNTIQVPRNLRL